jgi:hypothetical protein
MKSRVLIIIGIIIALGSVSTFVTIDYLDELPFELFSNVLYQLQRVLDYCEDQKEGHDMFLIELNYYNETHYIDNNKCQWKLLENYPNSENLCVPGQYVENNEHRIRNGTHIYNNDTCMWEILEICTGYCGEKENDF